MKKRITRKKYSMFSAQKWKHLKCAWTICLGAFAVLGSGCSMYTWNSQSVNAPSGMDRGVVASAYLYTRGDRGKAFVDFSVKPVKIGISDNKNNTLDTIHRDIPSGYLHWQIKWLDTEDIQVQFFNGDPEKNAPSIGTWKIHFDKTTGKITKNEWLPEQVKKLVPTAQP